MRVQAILRAAFGLFAITTGGATSAFALPLGDGEFNAALAPNFAPPPVGAVDFTAIVALSNCSGALVRYTTSLPEDKAMVLTNGHCFEGGLLDAGEVLVNEASTRTFRLLNAAGSENLATLRATKVLYATMTDTDMALYALSLTYAEIQAQTGVEALTISDHRTEEGAPMHVVSGYWRRIYSCTVDAFVYEMREDEWTWKDSIRYSSPGCETIGGTSGSPIVHGDTKEVIGVNNTGNEDGGRCTMNNPCEVDEAGNVVVREGASYGQEVYTVYSCLNDANQIDLAREGCLLPRP